MNRRLYTLLLSAMLILSDFSEGVKAQNQGDVTLNKATIYHTYGGHYLDLLYKQVLCMCSLYWLLAGYQRYRPGKIPDNKRNQAAKL